MAADQLLVTLLQHYQDVHDAPKTDQIYGTTAHLLAQLTNPLNLALLTSQLLTAPAIWQKHDGLRTAIRIVSIYNSAARSTLQRAVENAKPMAQIKDGPSCEDWTRAILKGADEYSKRWQHLLVLTGVLMGIEGSSDGPTLSASLRGTLEHAVVAATNLALESHEADGPLAAGSIVLALTYSFPFLSECHRAMLDCNRLLPLAVWAITGPEGFGDGHFLRAIEKNVTERHKVYTWGPQSPSFKMLQEMDRQPLMGNMGPLSRLAAFAAQQATVTGLVLEAHDALLVFTRKVSDAWQMCRLSSVDPAYEEHRMHADTAQTTMPALWQVLRKLMFGVVVTLQAIVSRSLLDPRMLNHAAAPAIATKSLQILRNIYFISSRGGNSSFQVYTFAYLTSIDVLGRFPLAAEALLRQTRPCDEIPSRHVCRTFDLFYLNLAEHLPLALPTEACDALIIKPATNYLSHGGAMTPFMVELFESSHSAILAVLSCPQHSALTISITPFYIVKLLESFPDRISPRQFRLAFKTVMQIVSPPFPIAAMEPHMSETLLEMLLNSISKASPTLLPNPAPDQPQPGPADGPGGGGARDAHVPEPFSAQSALTMALVDALPFLPLPLMSEWLTTTAKTLNKITETKLRAPVKQRFWDILVNGEMDVERAAMGVSWWGTHGGRELVLYGGGSGGGGAGGRQTDVAAAALTMSGALVGEEKFTSKL
ncbi:Peroxisomal biogenesis factor 8 [Escovopsis weberi]|uniref:Peroxisomal biogenesis factor 8 n=1 Tax=Escovopsis weberi TaxID=150374 RepID=A0A0M9VU19_ESCWE|nr:Peroxisomal biogenesis factor 8 [Escovopsis weberi]